MLRPQLFSIFLVFTLGVGGALAADSIEGELIANGDSVKLSAVKVEVSFGEIGLLITDQPLPPGCGVFDAFQLAAAGKLRGLAVSLSKETQGWEGQLGTIGEPELGIEQFTEQALKGSLSLAAGSLNDHTFSYDVRFDVGLKVERGPIEVSISGETDSEPAKAYIAYYEAMMASRLEDGKRYVVKENAEQMTGEDADFFLEMMQDGHPREAVITAVEQNGDEAVIHVEGEIQGCMSSKPAKAAVEMLREDSAWKVKLESWEM